MLRFAVDSKSWTRGIGAAQIGLLGLLLILAGSVAYLAYGRFVSAHRVQPFSGPTAAVTRGSISSAISASGSVVTNRQSRLAPQTSGRLAAIAVRLGETVKQGQVLATLDTTALALKLEQAQSNLRVSQLKLQQLQGGARPEEIAQAQAAVASAQGKLADVKAGARPEDILAATRSADAAGAEVKGAEAKRDAVKKGPLPSDVVAAQQAVNTTQSTLAKAESQLAKVKAGAKPEDVQAQQLAVEQAKDNLWAQQITRNGTCGGFGPSPQCDAANATVAAVQTTINQETAKLASLVTPSPHDISSAAADVNAARAGVVTAQAKLDNLRSGPVAEDVRQADAGVAQAQANYEAAAAKAASLRRGATPGAIEGAQSDLVTAQQQLSLKQAPSTSQDMALAQEQVTQAEIAVKQANVDLDNASLKAPYDGIVGTISANEGEEVASSIPILTIVDPTTTRIDASVDEHDLPRVTLGQTVQVTFDSLPDRTYQGRVVGIAPNGTSQNGPNQSGPNTYAVSVAIDGPDAAVPPGVTANLRIIVATKDDVLLIPTAAIIHAGGAEMTNMVVNGALSPQAIRTGLHDGQMTEVVSGLKAADTVAIIR